MEQDVLEIVRSVHTLFKGKGWTLSVAESCTGGLISHYITSLAGASRFFMAGVVTYSEGAKKEILGISPETIQRYGVISEETAREMAEKVRKLTRSDYSLATTGNLGPDVLEEKEKGLIYLAVSREGEVLSRRLSLKGEREANKKEASISALRLLVEFMEH